LFVSQGCLDQSLRLRKTTRPAGNSPQKVKASNPPSPPLQNIDDFFSQFLCAKLSTELFADVPAAMRKHESRGGVMAVLTILLIVAFPAVTLLLACFKGFSRALRHKKVSGVFVSVEGPRVRRPQGASKTLIDFSRGKTGLSKDPAPLHISSGTVALVGAAIVLRSRTLCSDAPARFSDPIAEPRRGISAQVPGKQPASSS